MPATLRHSGVDHLLIDHRLALQLWGEGLHYLQADVLFILEQAYSRERAGIGDIRLGPQKEGREYHLLANHEATERQMVAEQAPAPGFGERGRAKEAEVKTPLVEDTRRVDKLSEKSIEAHDIADLVETRRAETRADDGEDGLTNGR